MKNNYPIKYALMPIIKQNGWSIGLNELERKYAVSCYIVSKCYVVGENKKYYQDGTFKIKYSVVFVYEKDDYNRYLERVEPEFNLINEECTNSLFVDEVFESYEDAKVVAQEKNEEILSKKLSCLKVDANFYQKIEEMKEEQEENLKFYRKLESKIEENSTDLVLGNTLKEQSIVVRRNNDNRYNKLDYSLYNFIKLCSNEKLVVYTVSSDDYFKIISQLQNGNIFDRKDIKTTCLLTSGKDTGKIKVINYGSKKNGCFYLEDDYMYYDESISLSSCLEESELSDNTMIIYTMETYEDVINSYITKFVLEDELPKNEFTERVLKKKIELK